MKQVDFLIKADRISKSFRDHQIFRDLSIDIRKKEILGIWGPNGSGKSTLLKILTGLEKYESNNRKIEYHPKTILAYMPQDPRKGLFPWYRPKKYLKMVSQRNFKSEKEAEKFLLEEFSFSKEILGKKINQLSGGYIRRLSFASAVASKSNCLLLDEPFAGLDSKALEWTLLTLLKLKEKGDGIIIVTHDPETVILCSDRILVLKQFGKDGAKIVDTFNVTLHERSLKNLASSEVTKYRNRLLKSAYED